MSFFVIHIFTNVSQPDLLMNEMVNVRWSKRMHLFCTEKVSMFLACEGHQAKCLCRVVYLCQIINIDL